MRKKSHRVHNGRFKKILIVLVAIIGFPFAVIILLASLNEGRR
jgi:hypothetical protein